MLLSNVPEKAIRDRSPLAIGIGFGLAVLGSVMVLLAKNLADDFDNIFDDLPEAFTNLIGGSGGNYVITELFGVLAPVGILVIAISGGINALAREEADRTADLLLTQPITRRHVVLSNAAVLVTNLFAACLVFGVGTALAASVVDIAGFGPTDALAATTHLLFLGLAFGAIALAAANVSGSTAIGLGTAAGLAVLSNVLAATLPLVDSLADFERISPWYYYNGSEPLINGIDWLHLLVLGSIAVVAFVVAVVAVDHRDIRAGRPGKSFEIPALSMLARPHIAGVFAKTLSERIPLITIVGGALALMAVAISAMYNGLESTLADLSDSLPDSLGTLVGTTDMGTPVGWVQAEMTSIMVPLACVAVGVVIGVNAIAGEASRHTLNLLVVTPLTRSRIILEKAAAIVAAVLAVAVISGLGIMAGSAVAGLDLDIGNIWAAMAHIALLGIFFGMLGLAAGAGATRSAALQITVGVAILTYFANFLFDLVDGLGDLALLTPWHYASSAEPLVRGADLLHLLVLAVASAIAVGAAVVLFDRRELNG